MRKPILLSAALILLGGNPAAADDERPRNRFDHDILSETFGYDESTPASVSIDELYQGCPARDCIPSIDDPEYAPVAEVDDSVPDDALVMGIEVNGDARAYPLYILDNHEIVNDIIGGEPIAVTWCPLCGSGLAFERVVDGEVVEFGVSGLLHDSDLVMYDRSTGSLWQQITGEAILGPKLGDTLETVPASFSEWDEWVSAHPDGKVLLEPTDSGRTYGRDRPYAEYERSDRLMFPASNRDLTIHPKTVVYGFDIGGRKLAVMKETLDGNGTAETEIDGTEITIERHEDGSVTANTPDGKTYDGTRLFWFAWYNFHPGTERI
ncbi:MAG: DUF3179 domain-containing protein [Candidatus Wenzhouxiangella sp. M2_3B_020]